jgi:tyrosyl-tRNA synthetase
MSEYLPCSTGKGENTYLVFYLRPTSSFSVKARLQSDGLSFTEFTYQLLQAYDFYHLYKHHSCTIQVGGSDQWGNITAGLELIGRLENIEDESDKSSLKAFGFTTPLLTTSSGEKFGKSAGNAIWLDPSLTSVFEFYQVGVHPAISRYRS